ncbi:MAG: hypothetical protein OQL20_11625 [Sedimenticola sp.]|nr:hypothetical protein [Sedimenticola sp.]
MDLDKITVTVRPRTAWEAIDLGFTMARAWFAPLWTLWMVVALPVYLLVVLLLPDEPIWVILIVWWLKPLYEPMLLFWMSRALFDDSVSTSTVLRRGWGIVWPQLLSNITWRRFNPNRSFTMPVSVLEGLKGKIRRKRIAVLGRGQQGGTWLTIVGIHFEVILEVACIVLIVMMLPEELQWLDIDAFLFNPGNLEQWLQHIGDLLAMSVIAPFYVAAGFALYLTRRTELEAWDIELNLRQLMARRKSQQTSMAKLAMMALCSAMLYSGLFVTADLKAEPLTQVEAKRQVEAVLADDLFGKTKQVTYWKALEQGSSDSDSGWLLEWILSVLEGFTQGFAAFGKGVLLVLAGVALAWLIYKAVINHKQWVPRASNRTKQVARPETLFGLALDAQALPSDIPGECRRSLDQGDMRTALSLLYRGTLLALFEQDQLEIPDSATELECLDLIRATCPGPLADYFAGMTPVWMRLAYDHQRPTEVQIRLFCQQWEALFGQEGGDAD